MKKEIDETIRIFLLYICIVLFLCSLFLTCSSHAQGFNFEFSSVDVPQQIEQLQEAEKLGAKIARYQMYTGLDKNGKNTAYNREQYINRISYQRDKLAEVISTTNMFIIIDLHDCPNYYFSVCLDVAEMLYNKFYNNYNFIGIDINEPSVNKWSSYWAQKFIDLTNCVAPNKFAFVESYRGSPSTIKNLKNLRGRNWLASVHVYYPAEITHQGILGHKDKPYLWGKNFKKKDLEKYLQPVRDFQVKYGKEIYIGEFAAVRWSGFPRYVNTQFWVRDAISIFNKYGWHWSYLGFRNNSVWSPFMAWNRNDLQEYPSTWVLEEIKKGFINNK